jgi:uncharacterized lipoprotein YddW (UPF0748 family)
MRFLFSLLIIGVSFCVSAQPKLGDKNVFEFRGVWVATVINIDWPSKVGLSNEAQKKEFIALLDMHQKNGMNAIIMQVRPTADAFYPSTLEPWSEYLMGKQGLPPSPFYDPLQFMISETHKRGMEFHAWINPYRALFNVEKSSVAPNHLTKTHPEWFIEYDKKKIFNPGLPEVWKHTNRVVSDIVSRYNIDAIHLDDYFYPYKVPGKEFQDEATYKKYSRGLNKEDWRRSNCDTIIKQLSNTVHSIKPGVQFGISPFGVWRNKSKDPSGSNTQAGVTNYDDLYADIMLWLKKGWVDYIIPQLYWEHGHALADYDELVNWWDKHSHNRNLYIGHGIYRAGTTPNWKNSNELPYQIKSMRGLKNTSGSTYFSSKTFSSNPNHWNDTLQNNYYRKPALQPTMPWLVQYEMTMPSVIKKSENSYQVELKEAKPLKYYAILSSLNNHYEVEAIIPAESKFISLKALGIEKKANQQYWLVAVGLQNQLSKMVAL